MKLFSIVILIVVLLWSIHNQSLENKQQPIHTESKRNWNKGFNGVWTNIDEKTRSLTKCKIVYDNNSFLVQMWGSCFPEDCDWGENIARGIKKGTNKFELLWNQKFAESHITYELIGEKLKITNKRNYKDNSGRLDNTTVEYFQKE